MTDKRVFLHVDMDAFFAAVEVLDNPNLAGKPVIVGAAPDRRGVVCTCSYEAREFGVHSAMPSRTAFKLCPHGIFLPARGARYREISYQVFEVFHHYTPFVEKLSIDEAFMDITGSHKLFGGPIATAEKIRNDIREKVGITGSVGLAPNKFLAKLASDMNKPDGMTIVPTDQKEIEAFLAPLKVERIWGVGRVTAAKLHELGLETVSQLQRLKENELQMVLGQKAGSSIYRLCRGLDTRDINLDEVEKSISNEKTFVDDIRDWEQVSLQLLRLTEKVGRRLRAANMLAGTANIRLRWANFETITRQMPLIPPTDLDHDLIAAAMELLENARAPKAVRLVGFGVSKLMDPDTEYFYQADLFDAVEEDTNRERNHQLDRAVDAIREQFGVKSLNRGTWGEE